MGICAANMDDCDRKEKCIFGPNEGQAYDPKDPCCGVGDFNVATCDCSVPDWARWNGVVSYDGVITPKQTEWRPVLDGQPLALVALENDSCGETPNQWTFCGSPTTADAAPWNAEAYMVRGNLSCVGGAGGFSIYRYDPDSSAWFSDEFITSGMICVDEEGSRKELSGTWEYAFGDKPSS
jgi:hypothetical protein